jgi:hypothetical protein
LHGHNKPGTLFRMTANGQVAQIVVVASAD